MKSKSYTIFGLLAVVSFFSQYHTNPVELIKISRAPAQESGDESSKEEKVIDRSNILSVNRELMLPRRAGVPSNYLVFTPSSNLDVNVIVKADGRITCQQGKAEAITIEPYSGKQFSGGPGAEKLYCSNAASRELVNLTLTYEFKKVQLSWDQANLKDHNTVEKAFKEVSEGKFNEENEKILREKKIAFEGDVSITPNRLQTWDFGALKDGEYIRFHSAEGEIAANEKQLQSGKGTKVEGIPVKLIGKDKKPQKDLTAIFSELPKNAMVCYTENEKKEKTPIYVPGVINAPTTGPAGVVKCTINNRFMDKKMAGSYSVRLVRVSKEEASTKLKEVLDDQKKEKEKQEKNANLELIKTVTNAINRAQESVDEGMKQYQASLEAERKLQEEQIEQQKKLFGDNLDLKFSVGLKSFKIKATPVKKDVDDEVLGKQSFADYRISSSSALYVPIVDKSVRNDSQFEIEQQDSTLASIEIPTHTEWQDPTAIEEEFIICHDKIEEVSQTLKSYTSQKKKVSAASVRFFLRKLAVQDAKQCLGIGPKQKVSLSLDKKFTFCMAKTKHNYQTERASKDLLAYTGITIQGTFSGTFAGKTISKKVVIKRDKKNEEAHPFFAQTIYSKIEWKDEADHPLNKCFDSDTIFPTIDRAKVFPELKKAQQQEEKKSEESKSEGSSEEKREKKDKAV